MPAAQRSTTPTPRTSALWGGAATALLGLTLWCWPLASHPLRALSYDFLHLALERRAPEEAVVVSLDEASFARLGQAPDRLWDRALHARLLDQLRARGARAIAFDILFADPWPDPSVDTQFAQSLERGSGQVVLAASLAPTTVARQADILACLLPTEPLAAAARWGVVELPLDPDRVLRQFPQHLPQPAFAARAAELLGHRGSSPDQPRWIRFYGPPGTIRHVAYWQALDPGALAPQFFTNKLVFVGRGRVLTPTPATAADDYATPLTRWSGHLVSGVEVQATLALNLLRNDWLRTPAPTAEAALLTLTGALAGFALVYARPRRALLGALASVVVLALIAVLLCRTQRLWFTWLIPAGVQLPFACAWSLLAFIQRAAARQEIPDHTLLRRIGQGAYGDVWLARDAIGGCHAVKIVERRRFPRPDPFEREFHGIQQFAPISRSHPGLVQILHVGRNDLRRAFFYIMEAADDLETGPAFDPARYFPRTLAAVLARRGRLPADQCMRLALDLADALDHLHRHQLVHRDLKPANILFVNHLPKLADPGLVTPTASDGRAPSRVGTEGYIAPEGPGRPAADLYALGKLLYQAATGCDLSRFPDLPSTLTPGPDADLLVRLHEVLLTACETDPADRYPSAQAMRADLLKLQVPPQPLTPSH